MVYANKSSSFVLVFALLFSSIALSCIESCAICAPTPKPTPPPPASSTTTCPPPLEHAQSCPRDALKIGACADLLGLADIVLGSPPSESKCCALLNKLADLDAVICLYTAIKAIVLGFNLDMTVSLGVLLSAYQKKFPSRYM